MVRPAIMCLLIGMVAISGQAGAQDRVLSVEPANEPEAQEANGARQPVTGYAFDNPRLLTQQLLWGRLHGVRLLALACQRLGKRQAALAYVDWLEAQWPAIRRAEADLAKHYFGLAQAPLLAIDAAIGLQPELSSAAELIPEACQSLPEALAAPRHDLQLFYEQRREAIRRGDPDFPGATWPED